MKLASAFLVVSIIALIIVFQSTPCDSIHQDMAEMEEIEVEKDVEKVFLYKVQRSNLHNVQFDDAAAFVLCSQTLPPSSIFLEVDTPPPEMFSRST